MFWVDEFAEEIIKANPGKKEMVVRDEKTLSGRVHVGSLRGVVLHGIVAQALREKGINAHFVYEFNDVDPMDGLPVYLDKAEYEQHMGKPLRNVPSPDPSAAKNYAEYFGIEFKEVIDALGLETEYTRATKKYDDGEYDQWIVKAMENEAEIRKIYKEVSGSVKPDDWHPLQVVCENCGKIGTTKVTGWDGQLATYVCEPDMVKWAKGCGFKGKISPFKGKGKLPWKVEWPLKWTVYNVDVEGAGKDHGAAGGSYDIGIRIAKEVFKTHVPFNIPYEFFLFGGAKMSSSKGQGATAYEVAQTLPPELVRFLMIRSRPNQPIEFDPNDETIPRLFDRYDECADHYFGKPARAEEVNKDFARAFHFSQIQKNVAETFRPRFSRLVFMVQMPHLDIEAEVAKLKGSALTEEDKKELTKRLHYVRLWLNEYAPDSAKFTVQESTPEPAKNLSKEQKEFLMQIVGELQKEQTGEELHAQIHALRKAGTLDARTAFGAIYLALIGKDSGPQAGWFLEALDKTFVINRFKEVANLG